MHRITIVVVPAEAGICDLEDVHRDHGLAVAKYHRLVLNRVAVENWRRAYGLVLVPRGSRR